MPSVDIAVIIVTFRSAELTIESLRSVDAERSTAGLKIRAVVVDNSSGDLPTIAAAVAANGWSAWVTCVLAPVNGGFAYGNNLGIQQAYAGGRPAYVHLLNPDAQVRPGAIGALVQFLESHPDVGIAGGSFENLDGSDWPFAFRFPSILSELESRLEIGLVTRLLRRWVVPVSMTKKAQPIDWVSGASMMIRSAVFAAIGEWWLYHLPAAGNYYAHVLPPLILVSLGLGLCIVPVTVAATLGVDRREAGLASGLVNTTRQVGGALGLAALATIASDRSKGLRTPAALSAGFDRAFLVAGFIAVVGAVLALTLPSRDSHVAAVEQSARDHSGPPQPVVAEH